MEGRAAGDEVKAFLWLRARRVGKENKLSVLYSTYLGSSTKQRSRRTINDSEAAAQGALYNVRAKVCSKHRTDKSSKKSSNVKSQRTKHVMEAEQIFLLKSHV